jgi:hypothetical protein
VRCVRRTGKWAIAANADNSNDDELKYELIIYLYDEPGKFQLVEKHHRQNQAR